MRLVSRLLLPIFFLPLFLRGETVPPVAPDKISTTPAARGDGWWKERHARFNAQAKAGGIDVLFIGDSITQGWEDKGKEAWARDLAPLKAVNFGCSGDRTEHVLWRLENGNLDGAIAPKVVVLMIGTNNTGHRLEAPEHIAAGVTAIVDKLTARFPAATVLVLGIFPRGETPEDPKRLNNVAANQILAKLDNGKNVRFLDIGAAFLEKDGLLRKEVMPDFLHLSPAGYDRWAAAVVPEIRKYLAAASAGGAGE